MEGEGDFGAWLYLFDYRSWRAPWRSSLAQGLGIQALTRAFRLTGDRGYLDLAGKALRAFQVPIEDGGVLAVDPRDGGYWYEEYASEGSPRHYILNGFTYSLLGVYEYYQATEDAAAHEVFLRGVEELKRHVSEYDTGKWTYYDRVGNLASEGYHRIHVDHMLKLYEITREGVFLETYKRWRNYRRPSSRSYASLKLRSAVMAASVILSLFMAYISYKAFKEIVSGWSVP
ncbi:MAG: D-glucuronyl C5-epimerase family protein [Candidatus Bathyarchaeia archaeon]